MLMITPSTLTSRALPRLLLVFLLLTLSGCVWLRLLEIKNQLADFDENIRIEVADKHFIVHLLKPVLRSDDFIYLSKLQPSRKQLMPDGTQRWYLDFKFDPAKTPAQQTQLVSFIMTYTPKHRLAAFDFSPLFVEMAPPVFLKLPSARWASARSIRARSNSR